MSELRQDPTTGAWVAIAHERAGRQGALHHPPQPAPAGGGHAAPSNCPFCVGAEGETPREIARLRLPGDALPWRVRVVPNRYPAFSPQAGQAAQAARAPQPDPPFVRMLGRGHHEVVVETPRHGHPFWDFAPEHAALVLQAWQQRYRVLAGEEGVAAVVVFKNHGAQAGASLAHAHSQIVAVPVVPQRLALKQALAREHAGRTGRSLYAAVLEGERAAGLRIVLESPRLAAFAPYASRWPYETWLLPCDLETPFEALAPERLAELAVACQRLLRAIRRVEGELAFNLLLSTPPLRAAGAARYPWHLELLPRFVQPGGFELTTELMINPVPPELCAERLRQALAEEEAPG